METTIIFDPIVSGHHLEYLRHLWVICSQKPSKHFVFLVSPEFVSKKNQLGLQETDNIHIQELSISETKRCSNPNIICRAWGISFVVNRYVKFFSASKVFSISIIDFLPFFPLISSRSGIVYGIYLYGWKSSSFLKKIGNILKYTLFSRSRVFEHVFILNDAASARRLNYLYKTERFLGLPDPFLPIIPLPGLSIRSLYGIPNDKTLFVHFGSLGERKGTMRILDSLLLLNAEDAKEYAFVFAGKVSDSLSNKFYETVAQIKERNHLQIHIEDCFCDYSYIASICDQCDSILIPYLDTSRSSGLIGYSSQFGKPVVAPSSGLIGKLVFRYKLGLLLNDISSLQLINSYKEIRRNNYTKPTNDYCQSHTIQMFSSAISRVI